MWVKQCHKPPIWEWFIPPIKMVIWGMVSDIVLPTLIRIWSYRTVALQRQVLLEVATYSELKKLRGATLDFKTGFRNWKKCQNVKLTESMLSMSREQTAASSRTYSTLLLSVNSYPDPQKIAIWILLGRQCLRQVSHIWAESWIVGWMFECLYTRRPFQYKMLSKCLVSSSNSPGENASWLPSSEQKRSS